MKTRTHYLYGFIIVLLVIALVITSVSKRTPKTIETTPPVERTPEMVTLPPSDTDEDTDEDTDDNTDIIYDDKYYTIATYLFYSVWVSFMSFVCGCVLHHYFRYPNADNNPKMDKYFSQERLAACTVIMILLSILSLIFAIISLSLDTLDKHQKNLMISYTLFFPISLIVGGMLSVITPRP